MLEKFYQYLLAKGSKFNGAETPIDKPDPVTQEELPSYDSSRRRSRSKRVP